MMSRKPTREQLVAFAAGELNAAEAEWIASCLSSDAEAAREVSMLQAIISTMRADRSTPAPVDSVAHAKSVFRPHAAAAGESWWRRATRAVAELVFDSRTQPALAGFRSGGGAGFQLEFETESARVDLQFEPRDEDRKSWNVIGQVTTQASDPMAQVAVLSVGRSSPVHEANADEGGVFAFEVMRGEYEFCVRVQNRVLVLPDIRVE